MNESPTSATLNPKRLGRNSPDDRLAARQVRVAQLIASLEIYLREQYGRLSRKGDLAKAINYMLSRWARFARFVDDGRICMTNNAAERGVSHHCRWPPKLDLLWLGPWW